LDSKPDFWQWSSIQRRKTLIETTGKDEKEINPRNLTSVKGSSASHRRGDESENDPKGKRFTLLKEERGRRWFGREGFQKGGKFRALGKNLKQKNFTGSRTAHFKSPRRKYGVKRGKKCYRGFRKRKPSGCREKNF